MYEHMTKRMESIIKLANEIAREFGQEYVGTEHMLLAISREGTGIGARILQDMKVDEIRLHGVIEKLVKKSMEDTWVFGRLPGTPHFRNVMAAAIEEARQLESKQICSEHLLLALLREKGSVAHAALTELGVTSQKVRTALLAFLDSAAGRPPGEPS